MDEIESEEDVSSSKRILRYLLDWGIALAFTAIGFWAISAWRTPDLPDQAPSWSLESLEGESIALDDYKGKTVVLNFWATWCKPCIMEIPEFKEFSEENPDIPVFGIAVDGNVAELKRFAARHKITYPILRANSDVKKQYKVSSLPMTVIIDPEGEIKDVHIGIMMQQQLEWATR